MAALVWLLIPVIGAASATIWGSWATRRQSGARGVGDIAGVRGHERFRAAMERPAGEGVTGSRNVKACNAAPRRS